jgi:hypothetical protein
MLHYMTKQVNRACKKSKYLYKLELDSIAAQDQKNNRLKGTLVSVVRGLQKYKDVCPQQRLCLG